MMLPRPSLGDWFDPSCTPGAPGCVPHWYCYIPGMATTDCLQSFAEGLKQAGTAIGQTVGGVVGSTAGGVIQGTVQGVTQPEGSDSPTPLPSLPSVGLLALVGAGAVAVLLLARGGGR